MMDRSPLRSAHEEQAGGNGGAPYSKVEAIAGWCRSSHSHRDAVPNARTKAKVILSVGNNVRTTDAFAQWHAVIRIAQVSMELEGSVQLRESSALGLEYLDGSQIVCSDRSNTLCQSRSLFALFLSFF